MTNRTLRNGAIALLTAIICVPALAWGPDDFTRQKLPPQTESGMYDKRDLQSGPGPVTRLPRVPAKPVVIEPGSDGSQDMRSSGLPGMSVLPGGIGAGGTVDPVIRAESAMRKVIRRLD